MDWLLLALLLIAISAVIRLASRTIRRLRNRLSPLVRALRAVGAHSIRAGTTSDDAGRFADLFHWMWREAVESDEGLPPPTTIEQLVSSTARPRRPLAVAAAWSVAVLLPAAELQKAAAAMRPEGVMIAATAFDSAFPGAIRARVLGRQVDSPAQCAALTATLLVELGIRDGLFTREEAIPAA